jgi:hypothetical protein
VTAVTTAGLLAGLFGSAFVPAARADISDSELFTCETALDEVVCETLVDGQITLMINDIDPTVDLTSDIDDESKAYVKVTGATIVEVHAGASGSTNLLQYGADPLTDDDSWPATFAGADADGLIWFTADNADFDESKIVLERNTAGSATVTTYWFDNGIKTTVDTFTVTWVAAITGPTVDFTADETFVGLVEDGADCDETVVDDVETTLSFEAGDTADGVDLCISMFDKNGDAILGAGGSDEAVNIDVTIKDDSGLLDIASDGSYYKDDWDTIDGAGDGYVALDVVSEDSDVDAGSSKVTVKIEHENDDLGISATKTYTVTVVQYGTFTTITLSSAVYSVAVNDSDDAIEFIAKDAAGNFVPLDLTNEEELVIDSDISSASTMDDAGESDAEAAFDDTLDFDDVTGETPGTLEVACDATDAEKITVKVIAENGDGDDVTSNTVTVYCAEADADTLTYVSYVRSGATATVKVSAKDDNGYPVPDGTVIDAITSTGLFAEGTDGADTENGIATFTHLASGNGVAIMVFNEGTNASLTKAVAYGGTATLDKAGAATVVANFGSDAAGDTVTFTVEKVTTGKVLTITKVASATGRATYTLGAKRSGKWMVTATLGDEITNLRYVRR